VGALSLVIAVPYHFSSADAR